MRHLLPFALSLSGALLAACPEPAVSGGDSSGPAIDAGTGDAALPDSASGDLIGRDLRQDDAARDAGSGDRAAADSARRDGATAADGSGVGDGATADAAGGDAGCTLDDVRCGVLGIERCTASGWQLETPCPQGCSGNQCAGDPLVCTP
ncbi:MAG: hypothetical protein JXR83_06095, partial [Deltaproteobacteria bacterium]|nr:hypothetical protein [Deltaproteobacteria bacterium]